MGARAAALTANYSPSLTPLPKLLVPALHVGNHALFCASCAAPKGDPSCQCAPPPPAFCEVCAAPRSAGCGCEEEGNGRRVRAVSSARRWHGKSLCLCQAPRDGGARCRRPHRRDLPEARHAESCDCGDDACFKCRSHIAHFQLRTNAEMYALFKILEPELAEKCHLSTFISLKPYYVVPPTRRTCTCTYHNEVDFHSLLSFSSNLSRVRTGENLHGGRQESAR